MSFPTRNFFGFVDPKLFGCRIWSYQHGHSLMLVRAIKSGSEPDNCFYLTFENVQYFEGPLHWAGADFCVATTHECAELLRKTRTGLPDDSSEMADDFLNFLTDKFHLFVVELADLKVKILAQNANKTRDMPPNFHWLIPKSDQDRGKMSLDPE